MCQGGRSTGVDAYPIHDLHLPTSLKEHPKPTPIHHVSTAVGCDATSERNLVEVRLTYRGSPANVEANTLLKKFVVARSLSIVLNLIHLKLGLPLNPTVTSDIARYFLLAVYVSNWILCQNCSCFQNRSRSYEKYIS